MAVAASDVRAVQAFYPRIYLGCHVQHKRRSSKGQLTEAESNLLGHLDERVPIRASVLARHMGVSRPSMSAAIKRLTVLGTSNAPGKRGTPARRRCGCRPTARAPCRPVRCSTPPA